MRICLETLSCDNRTGIGRIVSALSRAFALRGHEVHVMAQDPGELDEFVHVHHVLGIPRSKALNKVLFRMQEERHLRSLNCDITYSFGIGRCADVVAAQSCHRAGMEILKSHSLGPWEGSNWGLYDAVSLSDEKALLTAGGTRRIIACSTLVKNQIVQYYGVEPVRIAVIPNGVNLRVGERSEAISLRKQWGITEGERVLLFMGNEFARKGLKTVLEAMARLARPDLRLLVAGGGNIQPYTSLTTALRLSGRVTFLGCVERPERLFGIADIFIFPTLYEPFGMVVLEAMAAGVPVITSKTCGAIENMTHRQHGIFLDDPTSAGEVAEWIQALLADEKLRAQLSEEGRNKAKEFCWDAIADRTLQVLEEASLERRNS